MMSEPESMNHERLENDSEVPGSSREMNRAPPVIPFRDPTGSLHAMKWESHRQTGRTALIPDRYYGLWPDGFVFYELDEITSETVLETRTIEPLIQEAMEEFENYTCIRFLKRNGNPNINNYLFIRGDAIGCWSYMGMNELGPQDLSIEMGQCDRKGIIMHELMHSLGFYHEHVRFDRDEYVKVHWENISPGREEEFYAVTLNDSQDLGVEYSFESIMHPELTVFTGNGRLTLEPIGEWAGTDPGPLWAKGRLAPSDIVQIDRLYECSDDGSSTRS
ncbi:unnamed protein product [Darwinula stevensoni]|uniref:Metalloendopeptidase n=1 Tax=Darwinula stevensoni TaxID=69355 RepID=A0A7R8X605_9CRUS|nr:unnamed protein product [Darwinula stevensoni]CAG0880731.1 unnamed protein product [Darwinula stevensoni]